MWTSKIAGLDIGWIYSLPVHLLRILPGDEVYELVLLSVRPECDVRRLALAGKGAEKTGYAKLLTLSEPLPG